MCTRLNKILSVRVRGWPHEKRSIVTKECDDTRTRVMLGFAVVRNLFPIRCFVEEGGSFAVFGMVPTFEAPTRGATSSDERDICSSSVLISKLYQPPRGEVQTSKLSCAVIGEQSAAHRGEISLKQ